MLGTTRYQLKSKVRTLIMIKKFIMDESGMETLEYAVIAGLIAVVAVLVYGGGWGQALLDRLNAATTAGQ
jgi:Flp pilus assembly pilin Flp